METAQNVSYIVKDIHTILLHCLPLRKTRRNAHRLRHGSINQCMLLQFITFVLWFHASLICFPKLLHYCSYQLSTYVPDVFVCSIKHALLNVRESISSTKCRPLRTTSLAYQTFTCSRICDTSGHRFTEYFFLVHACTMWLCSSNGFNCKYLSNLFSAFFERFLCFLMGATLER